MGINIVDVLLFLIVALSVWNGWRRGFVLGALDMLRWIVSLVAALFFYRQFAEWLGGYNDWKETWNQPFAFIMIVLGVSILFVLLSNWLLRKLPRGVHQKQFNRTLGVVPGFLNGLITAAVIAALLYAVPLSDGFHEAARESRLANRLAVVTEEVESRITPIFDDAIRQTFNRLMIEPGSNESVELPFRVAETAPRPDLEAQMLELINQERAAAGLAPLEADPEVVPTARKHSADMFRRGYFSHQTPENKSPFDRMREDGIRFATAGENLALAPTLQIAHTGLMNSPGHRANILRPQFGRVGIGIVDGGRRGLMVTQNFRN